MRSERQTALTRAFTGRLARGIRNRFLDEHSAEAPIAYPELHYVTAPLRQRARERGDAELVNLWAGEAHALAREAPAGEIVRGLVADAETALRGAGARLGTQGGAFKPGFEG
jgi:nitronate monooxygenase